MKQRRVGTFTLGLMLILIGIMIPLALYFKDQALIILQFSPIILVVLGIEILVYNIKFKEEKLKYDGLSIFLAIMITVVTIGVASITPMITNYVDYHKKVETTIKDSRANVDSLMRTNGLKGYSGVYTANGDYFFNVYSNVDIAVNINVHISKQEDNQYDSKKIFTFLKDLDSQDILYETVDIVIPMSGTDYEEHIITLNNYDVKDLTLEDIANRMKQPVE